MILLAGRVTLIKFSKLNEKYVVHSNIITQQYIEVFSRMTSSVWLFQIFQITAEK